MRPQRNKYEELDEIEKEAGNLLKELDQLEKLPNPTLTRTNYLALIQQIQTQMKDAILQGIQQNDREKFLTGLKYYEKNYEILSSIGDKKVCEDYQQEMIQILTDLMVHFKQEITNPFRRYFILISLQFIAKIYEDAQDYLHAIEIHLTNGKLLNSWATAIEYAAIVLDYLFLDDIQKATDQLPQFDSIESNIYLVNTDVIEQSLQSHRAIKLKEFCENLITAVTKDLPIFLQDSEELLKSLDISNNFAFDRLSILLPLYKIKLESKTAIAPPVSLETSQDALNPETQFLTKIKKVVLESLGAAQPGPSAASTEGKIDTSSLLTDLKKFISDSIKSMSQEIVANVSKFTVTASSSTPSRSSQLSDSNVPEIKIANPTDADEKPKRPKLSDVIGSIIVSE
jgi:hypothetical protein